MNRAVELHAAFVWTCDDCGIDTFARGVTIDDAMAERIVEAESRTEAAALLDAMRGDAPDGVGVGGTWLLPPLSVTCPHCGATFETED